MRYALGKAAWRLGILLVVSGEFAGSVRARLRPNSPRRQPDIVIYEFSRAFARALRVEIKRTPLGLLQRRQDSGTPKRGRHTPRATDWRRESVRPFSRERLAGGLRGMRRLSARHVRLGETHWRRPVRRVS